jgi:hypothetical protein
MTVQQKKLPERREGRLAYSGRVFGFELGHLRICVMYIGR